MGMGIENVVKAALFTPGRRGWGLPLLFWGPPGVGKTDIIEDLGRAWRMHVEVLSPGERGEGAFGVTPVPIKSSGRYVQTYPAPDWIDAFDDFDGRGILYLDEFSTAEPRIQAAMLGMIQGRRVGTSMLPRGVRVMGASNPPDMAANGNEINSALANRVGHMQWPVPDEQAWSDHILATNGWQAPKVDRLDPEAEEARVQAAWPGAWARAAGLVSTYHVRHRGSLHLMPRMGDPQASGAWPSHRTWAYGTASLATSIVHGLSEIETVELVSGFIGDAAVKQFLAWRATMDLPDPQALLSGKVQWEHDPDRIDKSHAVLSTLVAYATMTWSRAAMPANVATHLWQIIGGAPEDVIAMTLKPLVTARMTNHPAAASIMARIYPLLRS